MAAFCRLQPHSFAELSMSTPMCGACSAAGKHKMTMMAMGCKINQGYTGLGKRCMNSM